MVKVRFRVRFGLASGFRLVWVHVRLGFYVCGRGWIRRGVTARVTGRRGYGLAWSSCSLTRSFKVMVKVRFRVKVRISVRV